MTTQLLPRERQLRIALAEQALEIWKARLALPDLRGLYAWDLQARRRGQFDVQ